MTQKFVRIACILAMVILLMPARHAVAGAVNAAAARMSAETTDTTETPVGKRLAGLMKDMDWGDGQLAIMVADFNSP
ncbi:hypothetical protein LLG95_02725 [bacterium]|nr:hypothetical protein [bacterium]